MNVTLNVPALEKLLEYTASGIGSVAGPMFASWKARRESQAKGIAARGDVEAQRILAEGQASTISIIAEAQTHARSTLIPTESRMRGQLDIGHTVTQRIQFQEAKRQRSIEAVVQQAAFELGDRNVRDHDPDHDWTARFFNEVQDVSSEAMQALWAKVLAGEVERPNSTSIKTLSILRNLDTATAGIFRTLCSTCVSLRSDDHEIRDARVPSLGGHAGDNALRKYGLDYNKLTLLNEHGLITSDLNSWSDYRIVLGGDSESGPRRPILHFSFQGRLWVLVPKGQRDKGEEFRLTGVALSRSGQELSRAVTLEPMEEYAQALRQFLEDGELRMVEVGN